MDKVYDFLKQHKDLAFATVEGDKPKIRVFQIMKQSGNILYFATSPKKEVFRQLQINPNVELLSLAGDISVRIEGKALFDVDTETAKEIFDTNPVLQRLYSDYSAMAYFSVKMSKVDYYDLKPTPPLFESFEL